MLKKYVLIFLFVSLLSNSMLSQSIGYNESFQVSTDEVRSFWVENDSGIDMVRLNNGNLVYCWIGNDVFWSGIKAQVFDSNFVKIGDEFLVNTYTDYNQVYPSITAMSNGGFVITWAIEHPGANSRKDVVFQLFDENGNKISEETKVYFGGSEQYFPEVIELSSGHIFISWIDNGEFNDRSIAGRRFNLNGEPTSSIIYLMETVLHRNLLQILRKSKDSGFVIGFIEQSLNDKFEIQFFNSDMSRKGEKIMVADSIGSQFELSILQNGNILATWLSGWPYPYLENKLLGTLLDSEGNTIIEQFIIKSKEGSPIDLLSGGIAEIYDNNLMLFFNENEFYAEVYNPLSEIIHSQFSLSDQNIRSGRYIKQLENKRIFTIWEYNDQLYSKYYLPEIINHQLNNFSLIKPEYDATIDSIPTKFIWQRVNKEKINFPIEISYELYLSNSESFTSTTIIKNIQDTSYNYNQLQSGQTYFWKVLARNITGDSLWSSNVNGFYLDENATDVELVDTELPDKFELFQNYPNPFNPSTVIKYSIPVGQSNYHIVIKVYDVLGRLVKELVNRNHQPGSYKVEFNASLSSATANLLTSGIYFYSVQAGEFVETKKMLLLR